MKKNQLIIKAIMALALMMCGSNLAYAQFGSLKNVIKREATKQVNDAKRQATHDILREKNEAERKQREAAKQKAEAAVSETTGVSIDNSDNDASENTSSTGGKYQFKNARQCDWTIDGDINNIIANAEYYASKMQNSMSKGYKGLDYKSYCELNLSKTPLLYVMEARIDQGGYVAPAKDSKSIIDKLVMDFKDTAWEGIPGKPTFDVTQTLQQTKFIVDRGLTFSDEIARSAFFDMAYSKIQLALDKMTGSESNWSAIESGLNQLMGSMPAEYKARYPFTTVTLANLKASRTGGSLMKRKMGQLIYYKQYEKEGKYGTMPASKNANYEKQVKTDIETHKPNWGKVLSTSVSAVTGYKKNSLGVITHRHRSVYVLCEDQGYKALYELTMSEESLGKDKWGAGRLTGFAYEQDVPTKLVK